MQHLLDIRLQNYRSYGTASFEFDPGVNIIVGPNGSGKTNLLESIQLICEGSSYRANDPRLIKNGYDWSRLESATPDKRCLKLIKNDSERLVKEFSINSVKFKRLHRSKWLPVVLFEPNHLMLLHGGPDKRRDYLDELIAKTVPGYSKVIRDYKKTLSQRNFLLKKGEQKSSNYFPWDVRLSELAGEIVGFRARLIEEINTELSSYYSSIAKTEASVLLSYESSCRLDSYSSSMLSKLDRDRENDLRRGYTGCGPHRDDVVAYLNDQPVSSVASRGETRTIILSLKALELKKLEETGGKRPILLLDDVFSELDGSRRRSLTKILSEYQTFITTTDADVVVQHFMDNCNIIPLNDYA
jgi:DNA replication and repair protein RecF